MDGNTLRFGDEIVRLWGIDAPEVEQLCKDAEGAPYPAGRQSAIALGRIIGFNEKAYALVSGWISMLVGCGFDDDGDVEQRLEGGVAGAAAIEAAEAARLLAAVGELRAALDALTEVAAVTQPFNVGNLQEMADLDGHSAPELQGLPTLDLRGLPAIERLARRLLGEAVL